MSSEERMRIYLGSLIELENTAHEGCFSAFQAALHSGDAIAKTVTDEERAINKQAVEKHDWRLSNLVARGFLCRTQQMWPKQWKAKEEDQLFLYSLTAQGREEA